MWMVAWDKNKPGGLDSGDQSRARSRMSLVSRLTFENRQVVEACFYFFMVEIFKIETFQSRLSCFEIFVETVEIFEICHNFLRFVTTF